VSLLGWALLGVVGVSLLLAGAVRPWQLAVVHLLVAGVAFHATRLADPALAGAGDLRRLGTLGAVLAGAVAVGLLVVPRPFAQVWAPGLVAARPDAHWLALSLAPERTLDDLALLLLAVGFAMLVGLWSSAHARWDEGVERGLLLGAGLLVVLAFGHVAAGATSVLGVVPVETERSPFYAPLVNPNHLGALLVLVLPAVAGAAGDRWVHRSRRPLRWEWLPAMAVALGTVALLVALASIGAWLAAVVAVGAWLAAGSRRRWVWTGGVALPVALVALFAAGAVPAGWVRSSLATRLQIWSDGPAMLADHWGSGVGGGAFALAYPAYRTTPDYEMVHHAHSDLLEWVVETGMVGGVAAAVVLFGLWHMVRREALGPVRRRLGFGLLGMAVVLTYEFALQIPAVLLGVAGAVALVVTRAPGGGADVRRVRRWLWVLAVGNLVLAGWQSRREVADTAARTIAVARAPSAETDRAARWLRLTAPWRAEGETYRAWKAVSQGDREEAAEIAADVLRRHPADATALRRASIVLARAGRTDAAERGFRRSLLRNPNDYRTWAELSRLLRREGRQDEAVETWAEALRRWPHQYGYDGAPLREAYAMFPNALWWLHVLEDAPAFQSLYLARVLQAEGEPEVAELALEQAVFMQPGYAFSVHRAVTLHRLGQDARAEEALRAIIERHPDASSAYVELGMLLLQQDRGEEAREVLLRAERRHPGQAPVRIALIQATEQQSGPEAALRLAEGYLLSGRPAPAVELELARLQLATGHPELCVRTVDRGGLDESGPVTRKATRLREACLQECTVCGGD